MSGAWLVSYVVLWLVVVGLVAVSFLVLRQLGMAYLGTAGGIARDGPEVGARAPDFEASELSGGAVRFSEIRGWRLLVFGRAICQPCHALLPDLNVVSAERRGEVSVIFLCQGTREAADLFAGSAPIEVPIWVCPEHRVADRYNVRVTPFACLVDRDGIVRAKGLVNNRPHLEAVLSVVAMTSLS